VDDVEDIDLEDLGKFIDECETDEEVYYWLGYFTNPENGTFVSMFDYLAVVITFWERGYY
jgi:hypothetical protein